MLQHDAGSDTSVVYRPGLLARLRLAVPPRGRLQLALSAEDRAALGIWAAAHLALLVLVWASAWAFRSTRTHASLTGAFEHWDAYLLRNIAEYGYFGQHSIPHNAAFFPGYPLVLSVVHLIVRNWTVAELAVPAVAGCFAVVSLARLGGGRRATLYLVTSPAAIFLMVGYSEALFLALAVPAWHAATRGRWWRSALLAGLAGLVRPDALFLIPALGLMALTGSYRPDQRPGTDGRVDAASPSAERGSRVPVRLRIAHAATACTAMAGPAAYEVYLRVHTGTWMAWSQALQSGWDLHMSTPAQALRTTWWAAFRHPFSATVAFEFQLELGVMAVILLTAMAFAAAQRWPEAVYCALAVVALGTSTWYQTAPRTLLVLFPVWVALVRLGERRPGIRYVYLAVSTPIAVVLGLLFLSGMWAG